MNDSGHGSELRVFAQGFLLTLLCGFSALFTKHRDIGIYLLILSALGAIFTLSADSMRIMMSYESWIAAGMPSPNPLRVPIIATVFFTAVSTFAVVFFKAIQDTSVVLAKFLEKVRGDFSHSPRRE